MSGKSNNNIAALVGVVTNKAAMHTNIACSPSSYGLLVTTPTRAKDFNPDNNVWKK